MLRGIAALLAFVLLAPSALAWNQPGGDASRNAPLPAGSGPFDVLGSATLAPEGVTNPFWSSGLLSTPNGPVAAVTSVDWSSCGLVLFDRPLGTPKARYSLDMCDGPRLVAYDAATDGAIICQETTLALPVVEMRLLRDGSQKWAVRGQQVGPLQGEGGAGCLSAALDPITRELYVNVWTQGWTVSNHLLVIDVDTGAIERSALVPGAATVRGIPTIAAPASPGTNFERYHGVTLTSTGVVLSGWVACGGGACNEGVAAWFGRDLRFAGKERAATSSPASLGPNSFNEARGVSKYVAVNGPTAAFLLGKEVVLVNPEVSTPVARAPVSALTPHQFPFITQAVWVDGVIVLSLVSSLVAVDGTLSQRWSWTREASDYIVDVVPTTAGQLLVTVATADDVSLIVLDAPTGKMAYSLPLPVDYDVGHPFEYASRIAAHPGGQAVLADEIGTLVLLGVPDESERPIVTLSNAYPAPAEEFEILVRAPLGAQVARYVTSWGNGATAEHALGSRIMHAIPVRGDHDVRVTAVLADGRTRTTVATVHVGGTPPPELTALQQAFSPENQELTFFALGTLITIVGLAVTVGRHRRRFTRLEQELAAVEEIRLLSTNDPHGAVVALKAYRDRLPQDLARRRIDDSQYQVLDLRSARLLKVLRTRMFAPYDPRLSMRYHRLLDAAFEDAVLQPTERDALVTALRIEDALHPGEREEIVRILDEFTSQASPFRAT